MSDNYELISNIGQGMYGQVYKARHKKENKFYAIKQLNFKDITKKERQNIETEVKLLKELKHPNIVSYKDSFIDKANYFNIVTVFCEGGDMYNKIFKQKNDFFEEEKILDWLVQLLLGLSYIHDKKILHRDIKTQNIFIQNQHTLRIGDFGIAKIFDQTQTQTMGTSVIGTPLYMSPESFNQKKKYTYKGDIWSLGCCLFEMCNLKHAFQGQSFGAIFVKVSNGKRDKLNNKYSNDLKNIVDSMLQLNPQNRPTISFLLERPFMKKKVAEYIKDFSQNYQKYDGNQEQVGILYDQAKKFNIFDVKINSEISVNNNVDSNNINGGIIGNIEFMNEKINKDLDIKKIKELENNKINNYRNINNMRKNSPFEKKIKNCNYLNINNINNYFTNNNNRIKSDSISKEKDRNKNNNSSSQYNSLEKKNIKNNNYINSPDYSTSTNNSKKNSQTNHKYTNNNINNNNNNYISKKFVKGGNNVPNNNRNTKEGGGIFNINKIINNNLYGKKIYHNNNNINNNSSKNYNNIGNKIRNKNKNKLIGDINEINNNSKNNLSLIRVNKDNKENDFYENIKSKSKNDFAKKLIIKDDKEESNNNNENLINNNNYYNIIKEKNIKDKENNLKSLTDKEILKNKRIFFFKKRCIDSLGEVNFNRAYEYLKEIKKQGEDSNNNNIKEKLSNIIGEKNIAYWQLIDQILLFEDI